MNKEDLIRSAKKLKQPSESAAAEYSQKKESVVAAVNRIMNARPDLEKLIGAGNTSMMEDNHRNFALFMESLFFEYKAEVLVETVIWAIRAYKAHGFQLTYWPAELSAFSEVVKSELSPASLNDIYPIYNWITVNIPICLKISEEKESDS